MNDRDESPFIIDPSPKGNKQVPYKIDLDPLIWNYIDSFARTNCNMLGVLDGLYLLVPGMGSGTSITFYGNTMLSARATTAMELFGYDNVFSVND